MAIQTDTITLPSFWACALINGDETGMGDTEVAHMDAYLATALDGWYVVTDVEDSERFTWSYSLYGGDAQGGEVKDFIIHKAE